MKTRRHDYAAVAGIAVSVAAAAGGFVAEHGRPGDLLSPFSALIVFGGTAGAVVTGTPLSTIASALRRCRGLLCRHSDDRPDTVGRILRYSMQVRRAGLFSIEQEVEETEHGFMRRALLLLLDGAPASELRQQLEGDIAVDEETVEADARVYEQAGGYAPTVGIIGAVLGLIHVMKQFSDVDEVGRGIAAAFVSTLYGVALANLILLPIAARIRARFLAERNLREMIVEGVTGMSEGLTMKILRTRMEGCFNSSESARRPVLHPKLPTLSPVRKEV